jgi:hypothetical protein
MFGEVVNLVGIKFEVLIGTSTVSMFKNLKTESYL